ncbi:hydantoinase/oxoprolinase family protein [Methanobrevibacter sp. DSM 116169]|uniref:hydantoinase/oxoprolinase family protein n=1 Tax=Methanobrevibacter sp. DSM 116169 TaxID=3242727 RepID=UPI0038FC4CEB
MKIAGLDIGGANTDLAIVDFKENKINSIKIEYEYLPMWSNNHELTERLKKLIEKICPIESLDAVCISMTSELVDAYETKKEGVLDVVYKCESLFNCPIAFVGQNGVISLDNIKNNPLDAAAANWIATSQIASLINENCIFIDTGSTTTDIIPIKNGKECAIGRTDYERLATGELVYTGTLRTNLASFLDKIPINGKEYRIASELFAQTADIYMVLDKITINDYICDTFDGKPKEKIDCARRISRVVCSDLDYLSYDKIVEISKFIHKEQVKQIADCLNQVVKCQNLDFVVTTGLGKDILAYEAAKLLNLKIKSMDELLTHEECIVAPAIGAAILMDKYLN